MLIDLGIEERSNIQSWEEELKAEGEGCDPVEEPLEELVVNMKRYG